MPTLIPFEKLMPTIKKKNVCLSVVLIKFSIIVGQYINKTF